VNKFYTHKNHLKFGWGDGVYNFNDKDQKFWLTPGKVNYIPTSFKDECLRSARLIRETFDRPILVGLSGGIDSEVTARSFLEAGIPFEVAITNIIYKDEIVNKHDTQYAISFATKYGIKCNRVNVDFNQAVDRFTRIRATNNPCEPYYKTNISNICNVSMFEHFQHDYLCIKGAGDLVINAYRKYNQTTPPQYGLYVGESPSATETAVYEMSHRNSSTVINFFCYTPEAWLAWLLDTDVRHWVRYEKALMGPHSWMNNYAMKAFVLFKIWPDMEARPKLTGYELIPEYNELFFDDFYINENSRVKIPVDKFTEQLLTGNQCI